MIIDVIFLILIVMAAFKGYQQGLIVGIFSYIAFIVGLAAAMKLSVVVASRLHHLISIPDKWLPFIAFAIVFIIVVILVKWIARLIQFSFQKIMMGWLNRIGGMIFFSIMYISVFAILLFYVEMMHLFPTQLSEHSVTYGFIKLCGEYSVKLLGQLIPVFKGLFGQLQNFFDTVAGHTAY